MRRRGEHNSARRAGTCFEYAKFWFFSNGTDGNLAARFDLRAAYNVNTQRGSAIFGFLTEEAVVVTGGNGSSVVTLSGFGDGCGGRGGGETTIQSM